MNRNTVALGIGGVAIVAAVIYSAYKEEKLQKSIDKLTGKIHVDIEDNYVCEAVDTAIDREVHKRINTAASKAIDKSNKEMERQIAAKVNAAFSDLKSDVKAEMMRQVGEISIDSIKDEVIDEAKRAAVAKFKGDMDVVLKGYAADLDNVRKIHQSIADTLASGNEKRGTTLTIG